MRVLVVRGGWAGHEPRACTEMFIERLRARGCEVEVAESLGAYDDRDLLERAGLIVQCWTGGQLTEQQEQNLVERVAAGAGFAGWHGGIVATAYESPRYQFMVGGRFVCHPGGFVDYDVEIVAEHPVVRGIGSFRLHTEQYFCHVDPTLEVLATTTFEGKHGAPETAGAVMPVVWLRRFGRGRVFVSTLGHAPADLAVPEVAALTERGLLWAGGALDCS
ncbi:ThuA domain-containing protein [Actinoplanes sp. NBC_00393]|uniref:ThuA domain-containing protein n=1 Tax=Actinoplanes sp. NBC_00393 TaxID=2975953 RepID=UPI002E1B4824